MYLRRDIEVFKAFCEALGGKLSIEREIDRVVARCRLNRVVDAKIVSGASYLKLSIDGEEFELPPCNGIIRLRSDGVELVAAFPMQMIARVKFGEVTMEESGFFIVSYYFR